MRVLISGSSGLIGSALRRSLVDGRHTVVRLVRGPASGDATTVSWDPERQTIDRSGLEGCDAVVHLAGEPLLGRWTADKKRRIADSRVRGTKLIAEALASLTRRPGVLVCASAAGYYGNRGDEVLTEESTPGRGFLAEVVRAWESAADPARQVGIRVVHVRTGLVLARGGGLLKVLLLPFQLGLGGPIGSGRSYWSWIALEDLIAAYRFAIARESISGAINAAAPNPVTNREFARTLGAVLGRPAVLPVPPVALRFVFGREAADDMLSGFRLQPTRLQAAGFRFQFPDLEPALRHELGRR
ncbi:MAG: TIGR01777 family oxidoreductase [Acidobacteriota bacterium]